MDQNFNIDKELALIITDIIAEREKRGISQTALAKMTGLKQSAVSRIESLKIPPQLDTLIKILKALDLKLVIQLNDLKENGSMNIKADNLSAIRMEMLFCHLYVNKSYDEEFHFISEDEKEFITENPSENVLIIKQKNRKLIEKIFNWIPPKAELLVPLSFKGDFFINTKDGAFHMSNLNVNNLEIHTRNGKIECENIKCNNIAAQSSNGKAVLNKVEALGAVLLKTSNGRIDLTDVSADSLNAVSKNGKVKWENVHAVSADIKSSNGKIVLNNVDIYNLKAHSSNGKVLAAFCGQESQYGMQIEVINGNTNIAGKKYRGGYIFKDKDRQKNAVIYSKNGSVILTFLDSEIEAKNLFLKELSEDKNEVEKDEE